MARKTPAKPAASRATAARKSPYPSLATGPLPAERLRLFLEATSAPGRRPLTEAELQRWLDEHRGAWPDEREIDDFLVWLEAARQPGRAG